MKLFKTIKPRIPVILAGMLVFTGCGGGGGGGESGGVDIGKATSATTDLAPADVDEGTRKRLDLENLNKAPSSQATAAASGDTLAERAAAAEADNEAVKARVNSGTLTLEVDQVDRPESALVAIGDDDGERIAQIEVALNNTSAQSLEAEVQGFIDERERLTAMSEAKAYYEFETVKAYLDDSIDGEKYQTLLDDWQVADEPTADDLSSAIEQLDEQWQRYEDARIGESELEQAISEPRQRLDQHDAQVDDLMSDAMSEIGTSDYEPMGDVAYHKPSESFSRFIGRDALGVQTDDGWAFDDEHEQFALLADVANLASCYAGEVQ